MIVEPPAPTSSAATPRVLGDRYRLERKVATGGTAEVWDAHDERLARRVAVKTLHPHLAADETVRRRFRQEAVAAARLHHPSIVRVFDTCSDEHGEALVMEYVEGGTLRDLLATAGPLPSELVAALGAVVADALEHAHRNGMVHRDVKPSNILLSLEGRVLVADLGIAKLADGADITHTDLRLLGTARYLAPEQVEGDDVDARTDVYALGVVLYEAVCGRAPFEGDTEVAVAVQRLRTTPLSPRQVRADVDRDLEDVIMRALALRPDDRFASAADLRAALLAIPEVASVNVATAISGARARARDTSDEGTAAALAPTDATRATDDATRATGDATRANGDAVTASPAARRTATRGTPAEPLSFGETERRWLVPAVLIVVVAAALGTAAVLFSTTGVGRDLFPAIRDAVTGAKPSPVQLAGAQAFDPEGDGHEHDDTADLAVDGDPATAWTTEGYEQRSFGTKPGVGLIVTVDGEQPLERLTAHSTGAGWTAQVFVAAAPATELAGWGEPVGTLDATGTESDVDLDGRRGSAVLIWVTDLGEGGPPFRLELTEVTVSA